MSGNQKIVPAGRTVCASPNPQDVLGEYPLRYIDSWEEVAELGVNNIEVLLRKVRRDEESLSANIGQLREKQKLFKDKSGADFAELAKAHEYPIIASVGVHAQGWSDRPEPTDQESLNRARGSSEFNLCGWCPHASGSHRYNYCISGSCGMLRECDKELPSLDKKWTRVDEQHFSHSVEFDTKCILPDLTAEECTKVDHMIELKVERLKGNREEKRAAIRKLITLRDASDTKKPWILSCRPCEYMNVGDEMVAYLGNFKNVSVTANWVDAIGIYGYRHHDGVMSYQAAHQIHDNYEYCEGRGGGAGLSRPELMHRWEFDFLSEELRHGRELTFLAVWLRNAELDRLEGFDRKKFLTALRKPVFVKSSGAKIAEEDLVVNSKESAARVLQMLSADLFETEREIKSWASMQLRCVHPDKIPKDASEATKKYATRQTKAIYDARDYLINALPGQST